MSEILFEEKILNFLKTLVESERNYLEFWIEIEEGYSVEKRDHKLFKKENFKEFGLAVRYIDHKGRCGFAFTTSSEIEAIKNAYQKAKELSLYGVSSKVPEKNWSYPKVEVVSCKKLALSESISLLEEVERRVLNFHPSISRVEKCSFEETWAKYIFITKDSELTWEGPFYYFSISVVAESKEKSASSFEWNLATDLNKLEIFDRTDLACKKALALSKTKKGKSLKVPVLLPPFVVVNFLEVLSFSFLGDEVLKGRSFLKDKLGKKTFSENITLYDDGLTFSLVESRPFDDEGAPQNKKVLVENGIVKQFLFNTYWKEKAKEKGLNMVVTGNARRDSLGSLPKISPTNFYLKSGNLKPEDLLKREREIFEVLETLGTHTINPISGDFSIGVSGIYYKEGEPREYFCELALSSNLFELFLKVIEVGSDLKFYGNIGSPTLLIEKLDLGG